MLCFVENKLFDTRKIAPGYVYGSGPDLVDNPDSIKASYRGIIGLWGNLYQLIYQFKISGYFSTVELNGKDVPYVFSKTHVKNEFCREGWTKPAFLYDYINISANLNDPFGFGAQTSSSYAKDGNSVCLFGGSYNTGLNSGILALHNPYARAVENYAYGYRLIKNSQ